jgi:quercetin dioxygenase-like cupin family protein
MRAETYVVYPHTAKIITEAKVEVVGRLYINEAGRVCFGSTDFAPRSSVALHSHNSWEVIFVDTGSEGPGFVFFDNKWWRADPGTAVFVPKGLVHGWSAGNSKGFKMLWTYEGSVEEAGRNWAKDHRASQSIGVAEERDATLWVPRT